MADKTAVEIEAERTALVVEQDEFFRDKRGGVFFVINDARVHEDDLKTPPAVQPEVNDGV